PTTSLYTLSLPDALPISELDDDAHGVFPFDHVKHVFDVQGFEIEPVGDVEIRGNRLRIVVDDHRLVSRLPEGADRVHGGVVELEDRKSTRLNSSHVKISY